MLLALSITDLCPSCKSKFAVDDGELVCPDCGIVPPSFDPYVGAEMYGRAPQSHCVYGGGLGTDIFSKSRGEDGSNAPSFDLHGGNGDYEPVVCVMQPWDLLRVVEPDQKIRALREKTASKALKQNFVEYPCPECDLTFGNSYALFLHIEEMFQRVFGFDSTLDYVAPMVNGTAITKPKKQTKRRKGRIDEITLSNESRSIIAEAKKLRSAAKHLIADKYSREEMDINDPIIFGSPAKEDKQVREMLTTAELVLRSK